jgi:tape measure domain-containing protein
MDIPVRIIIDAINNAGTNIKGAADQLKDFGDTARTAGAGMAAIGGITALVTKSLVEQAGAYEQNTIAFETMLGSVEKAKTLLNDIKEFAKATPFNLEELVEGSKKLLAYNVSAEQIIPTLDSLGNIAAGVGKDKLPQLILAFGQVKAATHLTGAELRQFSEAGVPLLQALVDQANATGGALVKVGKSSKVSAGDVGEMNQKLDIARQRLKEVEGNAKSKTSSILSARDAVDNYQKKIAGMTTELNKGGGGMVRVKATAESMIKAISDGSVTFDQVQKALSGMTGEGGKFNDLMQKQAASTLGKWSNVQDAFQQMQITIGKGLLPVVNQLFGALIPLIDKFTEWATANPELIKNLLMAGLAIGGLGTILVGIGLVIPPIIATFTLLGTIIGGVISFFTAIGGVIGFVVGVLGGPLTLAILAITGIIALFALAWKNNWLNIQSWFDIAKNAIGIGITAIVNFFTGLWNYILNLPVVFEQFVERLKTSIYVFFTETLPFAIGFLAGRLVKFVTEDVPAFIVGVIAWFEQLPQRIGQFMIAARDWIVSTFIAFKNSAIETTGNMVTAVVQWFGDMKDGIGNWLSALPGVISKWFTDAKDNAVNLAKSMYDGVKEWFEKVVNFFKDIVEWAGKAISKAGEAVSAGFNAGKRQFGGPVNSFQPVLVGEAGPEMFVPQGAGSIVPSHEVSKGGGGTTIQFIINSSLIVNSPNERRSIAEALYKDLVALARSQDMSVASMFGG